MNRLGLSALLMVILVLAGCTDGGQPTKQIAVPANAPQDKIGADDGGGGGGM